MEDTTWTEGQDPEFIKELGMVKNIVLNLATELNMFMSIYYEYTRIMSNTMMFSPGAADGEQNAEGIPTQTSEPEPANRAERREQAFSKAKAKATS